MYELGYVEVYDLVMRGRGKNYAGEAAEVARLARLRNPAASSLLDVACGTGLHLEQYATLFTDVEGVDLSEDMLALARSRVPGLRGVRANMRALDLDGRFDVITCMFAVPHLESVDELTAMIDSLLRHLTPGGLVVVEPWYGPAEFLSGYTGADVIRESDRSIVRLSHSTLVPGRADRARMVVHYAVAEAERGLADFTEAVELTLFTHEEYREAFARAGCSAEFVSSPYFPLGLWIARQA
ncbi:class I SAM-dependent methyltransferase [Amycolatopsis suaedae]|uniref:Class I SAM-dependent methyltransferase n=1 Tax=Amycolatopsis suaedae TaxID=2510978 RepID=A0A4Q7JGV3_9PSEU|nr:class I SAM-dependent methyltransferase [Amycolatopsis suaedae]